MIRLLTLEQTGLTDGRTDEHQTLADRCLYALRYGRGHRNS